MIETRMLLRKKVLILIGLIIISLTSIVIIWVLNFLTPTQPINIIELNEADALRVIYAREGGVFQNIENSHVKKILIDFLEKNQERFYTYETSYFGDQSYQDDVIVFFEKSGQLIGGISLIPDATLSVSVRGKTRGLHITKEENQMLRNLLPTPKKN